MLELDHLVVIVTQSCSVNANVRKLFAILTFFLYFSIVCGLWTDHPHSCALLAGVLATISRINADERVEATDKELVQRGVKGYWLKGLNLHYSVGVFLLSFSGCGHVLVVCLNLAICAVRFMMRFLSHK